MTRDATARLFVAIDPPADVREGLLAWARAATARLPMQGCATRVGELSLGAPLWLPPRRPRALAVEIHDDRDGGLARLHGALRGALADATGWQPERRRFKAHITVARMRGRSAIRRSAQAEEAALPATPPLNFTPEAIVLYRSWLSPAGASYQALVTCDLLAAER